MKRKIYNVLSNMILSGDNVSRVKSKGGISRKITSCYFTWRTTTYYFTEWKRDESK